MRAALVPLALIASIGTAEPPKAPAMELVAQAEGIVAKRYASDGPGAAVLVAREGKPLFRKGYGLASVELGTPISPEMVFRIGSLTKQFTAASILLLVEEGKLDLQAPISRYLDKAPKAWDGITVEMLLNHTSGIYSYTSDPTFDAHGREAYTPQGLLDAFVTAKPLDFAPGVDHKYNNSGYFILGMILEKVSGQPWHAFMKTRIFDPLGMKHTRVGTETDLIPGMVQGYAKGPVPAPYLSMTQPGAAGALVSTVDDLAAWTLALHGGKVLKPESLKRMLTRTVTKAGKTFDYGYGIALMSFPEQALVGHGGGVNGFVCFLAADPAKKTVAVILNNTTSPKGSDAESVRRLLALAAGKTIPEPKAAALDAAAFDACAGEYELAPGFILKFWREGDKLFTQATGQSKAELFCENATTYFLKIVEAKVVFSRNADGKVEAGVLHQGGQKLPLKRVK